MNTIVSTVLISAPIAFMAGWVVAKAVFNYMGSDRRENDYKRLLQQQQQAVTERDGQIAELHARLDAARKKFRSWRGRIRPIAKQFRQQRVIITELRDELRRRDAQQQAGTAKPKTKNKAKKTARVTGEEPVV